jgi:hypothetical protein
MRVQRTRSSPSALRSPLTRHPLGGTVAWVVALALALSAGCSTSSPSTPPDRSVVDYCEVVTHPDKYLNHELTVRAVYSLGFETSFLSGADCQALSWVESNPDWRQQSPRAVVQQFDSLPALEEPESRQLEIIARGTFSGSGIREFGHQNCCEYHFKLVALEKVGRSATKKGGA